MKISGRMSSKISQIESGYYFNQVTRFNSSVLFTDSIFIPGGYVGIKGGNVWNTIKTIQRMSFCPSCFLAVIAGVGAAGDALLERPRAVFIVICTASGRKPKINRCMDGAG